MQAVIDNLSINYEVYGQGERLLLLHGWGDNLETFEQVIPKLSSKFQVIAADLPGFGKSQAPQLSYGVYDYANFVEKFLDYLDIKETFMLGHSMGGAVAIAYAASFGRARKIILEDSAGIRRKSLWTRGKVYLVKLLGLFVTPAYRQHFRQVFGSTDYKNAGKMRATLVKIVNEDLSNKLPAVKQPTLIIWGQNDETTTTKEARLLNWGIKGSRLEILPACSHFPHLERAEEFARIVIEFLKES